MNSYFIESDGCKLQVYARGLHHTTAIIFLHGGPGSGAKAIFELPAFQAFEDTYLCIHFDQRGSGESHYDLQQGLSIEQICMDVKTIVNDTIQRFGCKQVVLWGGSFGGALACLYMQHHGEGINAVILNNPAITFQRSQGIAFYERMRQSSLSRMPENMRSIGANTNCPAEDLQDLNFKAFVFSQHNPSNSLRHICAMSTWFFNTTFEEAFKRIKIPTLLLLGKEDPICKNVDTIEVVEQIGNTHIEMHVLSPCGHAIFEDRADDFVCLTKTYLQNKGFV